jgi:hypothetical protein
VAARKFRDYNYTLRDALKSLAEFERRNVAQVINDIVRVVANVITVRVVGADTKDGTIPINDGVLLIAKASKGESL